MATNFDDDDSEIGNNANNNLSGNNNANYLQGNGGNDTLNGTYGHHWVNGGTGNWRPAVVAIAAVRSTSHGFHNAQGCAGKAVPREFI